MVGHDFACIDLLSGELAAAGRDFEKVAAHAVAGTDIDEAVRINRRWDDCDVSFARRAPEQLAVGSRDADDTRHRHLNILPHAANLGHDERRVLGRVGEFFALPNQRAGLFVERDDGALGSAGREGHVRAIHQGGLGEAPFRTRTAEVFRKVFAPPLLARGGFQASQLAPLADGVEQLAVHGRRSARTLKAAPAGRARFAEAGGPGRLAISRV